MKILQTVVARVNFLRVLCTTQLLSISFTVMFIIYIVIFCIMCLHI